MCATTCFTNTSIRWAIYAFVNDTEEHKKRFSIVLQQLQWKNKFKSEVVPRLKKGNRYVVIDSWDGEGCNNCYLYGRDSQDNSLDNAHYNCGSHGSEKPSCWMSFEEFKSTCWTCDHFRSFEEFDKWNNEHIETKQRELEKYSEGCDKAIEEYYSKMRSVQSS